MFHMKKTDDLDKKLELIIEKIKLLEEEINTKVSDSEREAKQSSKKTSEYRNRAEEAKNTAQEHLVEVSGILKKINQIEHDISNIKSETLSTKQTLSDIKEDVIQEEAIIQQKKGKIEEYVNSLENIFENHPDLDSELEQIEVFIDSGEDKNSKIDVLYKTVLSKKQKVDQLYYEIIGYVEKDENDEEYQVEGLKGKLEKSYVELEKKTSNLKKDIEAIKNENIDNLNELIFNSEEDHKKVIDNWEIKYNNLENEISSLLPNALTAGLSSAYSTKKEEELKESKKLVSRFYLGIVGLILVSIIPFAISYKSFLDGIDFEEIIFRLPRVVASILPLYIPVLWLAYSANKKMNLSKRLIEEYSHKEVLSKTFEGLSKQVNSIDDDNISTELRLKLLYNILDVSSENPGKLISDYNKSDHPLMDALEKSTKLSKAVEKLDDIPGLQKLSKLLDNKSKKIINEQAEKIDEALDKIQ